MKFFKQMNQSIQESTKKNLRKTAFKKTEVIWSGKTDYNISKFLKAAFQNF